MYIYFHKIDTKVVFPKRIEYLLHDRYWCINNLPHHIKENRNLSDKRDRDPNSHQQKNPF